VERPGPGNGSPTNLSNFATMAFQVSEGNGITLDQFTTTGSPTRHMITMYSGSIEPFPYIGPAGTGTGNMLTSEGSIGANGAFTVQLHHCM